MRWWILALLFTVTVINFVDRQALSVLAPIIRGRQWALILLLTLGDYRPVRLDRRPAA